MKKLIIIGRAEKIDLPEQDLSDVPARVDTGAKTSAIWASNVRVESGQLKFSLFDQNSPLYTGQIITTKSFNVRSIASSNGAIEERYVVKLLVKLHGKKIRASFSLANRATQVYPVLIGRNVLRGKFVVNVKIGSPLIKKEKQRSKELQS